MRDEELLRQYLLGELPGEDEALLEARLIRDKDLFERAEAIEADLLEEHAHGRLSAAQVARMRRHLAASSATRSQLAVVRGLGKVAEMDRPDRRILTGPWGRVDTSRPRTRALAAAAMLAITVASAWIGRQTVPLPPQGPVRPEIPAPPLPPLPTPAPPVETPAPEVIVQVESTPEAASAPAPAPEPAPWLFQVALTGIMRGEAEVPKKPVPAPGTKRAAIEVSLGAGYLEYDSYEVLLSRPGETVFHEHGLEPRGQKLLLEIDPEKLQEGTYVLVVNGVAPDRPAELLAELEIDLEPAK